MNPDDLLEAQKTREGSWVTAGAQAFMTRLGTTDPMMTPTGKAILRGCYDNLVGSLEAFVAHEAGTPRPMQSPTFRALMALGCPHAAAITLHSVTSATIAGPTSKARGGLNLAILASQSLGAALEHDIRFKAWRENADDSQALAITRMRESMISSPKAWKRRLEQLRETVEVDWDKATSIVVGMDLIGCLVVSCPDVFKAPTVDFGHKSYFTIDLTAEASARLLKDTEVLSLRKPRFGMMLVKPRPWRYE